MNSFAFTHHLLAVLIAQDGLLHDRQDDGSYHRYTSREIGEISSGWWAILREHEIDAGDSVVLMVGSASTRWVILDLLIQSQGAMTVLINAGITEQQLISICKQNDAKIVITSQQQLVIPNVPHYYINQPFSSSNLDIQSLPELTPQNRCSVIYTSGTSGQSRGVVLTHENIMSNARSISLLMPMNSKHTCISFLPYSHAFERTIIYAYILRKTQIYFIKSPENLASAFIDVRPHFLTAVPRVLERMYNEVVNQFSKSSPIIKKLFDYALELTKRYEPHQAGLFTQLQVYLIRHVLLGRFRKRLGGRLIAIMVGAAHLRPIVARSFTAMGIRVREGYGMTEASPVITVNRFEPGLHRLGTVGLPLPGVSVRISNEAEDQTGEVEFKGPNLMHGYLNDSESTSNRITSDGYFRTGDVGYFDPEGFLVITDRAKDIFKTSSGKYVSPAQLTQVFLKSAYIKDILIIGFQRPYVTALIYPNFAMVQDWATDKNVHWTSEQYMVHNVKIRGLIDEEIESINQSLPNYQKLRAYYLLHEPFSISKGELSSTLKPIRKVILAKYQKEIEKLYENPK